MGDRASGSSFISGEHDRQRHILQLMEESSRGQMFDEEAYDALSIYRRLNMGACVCTQVSPDELLAPETLLSALMAIRFITRCSPIERDTTDTMIEDRQVQFEDDGTPRLISNVDSHEIEILLELEFLAREHIELSRQRLLEELSEMVACCGRRGATTTTMRYDFASGCVQKCSPARPGSTAAFRSSSSSTTVVPQRRDVSWMPAVPSRPPTTPQRAGITDRRREPPPWW